MMEDFPFVSEGRLTILSSSVSAFIAGKSVPTGASVNTTVERANVKRRVFIFYKRGFELFLIFCFLLFHNDKQRTRNKKHFNDFVERNTSGISLTNSLPHIFVL
jgi:hypothetical protein